MSLRLVTQIAGIAGSIASVVGVSTSNYRSKRPANTDPTHKWKIEIPESIDIVLDCTGREMGRDLIAGEQVKVQLKLSTSLGGGEDKRLIEGEQIPIELYVEFKEKYSERKFWPVFLSNVKEKINIAAHPGEKSLIVRFGTWNDRVGLIEEEELEGLREITLVAHLIALEMN